MGKWVSSLSCAMLKRWGVAAAILIAIFVRTDAQAFTVHVVDDDGKPITNGFRWLVMADDSYHVTPGQANPTTGVPESFTLGVNIHHSGGGDPVANGDTSPDLGQTVSTTLANARIDLPRDKRYIVSVLPWHSSPPGTPAFQQTGWTMSGRNVDINQTDVTVIVHKFPVPTAQLTIIVFEDTQPTNAAYDQPQEHGLGGFDLLVTDTVGKVEQDAWGNPLGTTYKYKCPISFTVPYAGGVVTQSVPAAVNPDGTCSTTPLPKESQPEYLVDPLTGAPLIDFKGGGKMTTCIGDIPPTPPSPANPVGSPGHPYPTAWTADEMANCVDPYDTTTRTINGQTITLQAPMGTGEAVVRYLPQNHYLIEPIPPANDPNWIGPTNTLEGGRSNDNWARPGEPRFNITLNQLNWISFFGFVKACNNGPTGLAAAAPTATVPNGTACHGLDPTITPPPVTPAGQNASTIRGQIVLAHDQHAPLVPGLAPATPVPDCFVALNNLSGADEMVYAGACNADSTFEIRNVPPGTYQLATWDKAVNYIIDYRTITVPANAPAGNVIDMGMIPIFSWFGILQGRVFSDKERTGTPWCQSVYAPDCPSVGAIKPGIANIRVNLRFTDGAPIYGTVTDMQGNYAFTQFFPFWRFLVAEISPDRFRPTGMTSVADDGGDTQAALFCSVTTTKACNTNNDCPPGEACTGTNLRFGQLFIGNAAQIYPGTGAPYGAMGINPQVQPDGQLFRTEQWTTLPGSRTEAVGPWIQDMISRIDWGLDDYRPDEKGSVTGMISYDLTRTEEDPAQDVLDGWEPGVPGIQVNLYKDLTGTGQLVPGQLPFRTTFSTAWNDAKPTGCVSLPGSLWGSPQVVNGVPLPDCAETFKTWNQVRPAPYDGYYTFDDLPVGKYIVQVVPPSEYHVRFWGDRDIDFGDPKTPFLEPPVPCVGDLRPVPQYHVLFPDQQVPTDYPGGWFPGLTAPACDRKYADLTKQRSFVVNFGIFTDVPIPSRMWGTVWNDLMLEFNPSSPNAAGNLALSWCPVAIKDYKGQTLTRMYTDQWGHFEAMAPSNYDIAPPIPIGLVVSQYTVVANDPGPILDTRPGSVTQGQMITDPFFNPAYGVEVIRENWPFLAGQTTFIDTIVIPNSAFVGNRVPINCDFLDHSPEIFRVDGPQGGPIVFESGTEPEKITIQSVGQLSVNNPDYDPSRPTSETNPTTITRDHGFGATPGSVTVTYKDPNTAVTATVAAGGAAAGTTSIPVAALSGPIPVGTSLDFGANKFARLTAAAAAGATALTVTPLINPLSAGDSATFAGTDIVTPLVDLAWAVDGKTISATVPPGIRTGQLTVTRGDNGKSTTVGVTLHVNDARIRVHRIKPPADPACFTEAGKVAGCRPIQDAIDDRSTRPGDLILMAPGRYMENVIMWKPVQLQGYGAESTVIDNVLALANFPLNTFQFAEIQSLLLSGDIGLVPGAANDFLLEQGAGILVNGCVPTTVPYFPAFVLDGLGCPTYNSPGNPVPYTNYFGQPLPALPRIDGLTITGSTEAGGAILVNGFANRLQITNNEIFANQGSIHGGIRFGNGAIADATNPTGSSFNPSVVVDHNRLSQNGSLFSGGGGVAIYTGTDNYRVTNNFLCGNFSAQYGGGIGHFGLSNNGLIAHNQIVSNESFDEGGGIHVGGEPVPAANTFTDPTLVVPQFSTLSAANPQTLTLGAGSVIIDDNLIHGNKGGDDGGGIRTLQFSGEDVRQNPTDPSKWHEIDIFNNMIVDNSSADHGGGLSFDDTLKSFVVSNTIANNDATSTAKGAFGLPQCTNDDAEGQFCPNLAPTEIGGTAGLSISIPQVGGIASFAHSTGLNNVLLGAGSYCATNGWVPNNYNPAVPASYVCAAYANPVLQDNVIWHNRSFYWDANRNNGLGALVSIAEAVRTVCSNDSSRLCTLDSDCVAPGTCTGKVAKGSPYWDMTVYGTAATLPPTQRSLNPTYSILTDGIGSTSDPALFPGNTNHDLLGTAGADPRFVTQCEQPFLVNQCQAQDPTKATQATPSCQQPFSVCQGFNQYQASMKGAALGNFVAVNFTPNGLRGDYHTGTGSSALDAGFDTGSLLRTLPTFLGDLTLLNTDFDGKPRPLGAAADIGANEQLAATTSFPVMVVVEPAQPFQPLNLPLPSPLPNPLDFGKAALFQPVQKTVKIVNYGQQNLIVAGATTNNPMFSVTNWIGLTTLAPGDSMTIVVAFVPTTTTPQTADLTIVSNATQSQTATVTLQGSGF